MVGGTKVRYDQFDALGRVLKSTQVTDAQPYGFEYSYNAAGGLERVKYPSSNRVVYTCYDQAGRAQWVRKDSATGTDVYAEVESGIDPEIGVTVDGYHATGGMQRLKLNGGADGADVGL